MRGVDSLGEGEEEARVNRVGRPFEGYAEGCWGWHFCLGVGYGLFVDDYM